MAATSYTGDDVYKVDRIAGGFHVRHYPDADTRRACCNVKVMVTDEDRQHATPEDPHGEVFALHRNYLAIEKKHGR